MRGRRAAWFGIVVTIGVGLWSTMHGTITDTAITYRAGMAALLVGLSALIVMCAHRNTLRLMAHCDRLAQTDAQTRQQYAEMGWRAARADASRPPHDPGQGAQILTLPAQQKEYWHNRLN